ncbi:MAG: glycosyltransferase family 4 protein [Flavobacteriaceae bacterium]|nr:glycosyltransferase family 4 protein [Flavobacteriaceae bacterium]
MKNLLIIGHTFPEPTTTAAGSRMMQLISLFQEQGFTITFASTALESNKSEKLSKKNIKIASIELNSASFDEIIFDLNPSVVLFDRFITEEQFGWRVIENCPKALRILDTEDLHFLRKARQEAVKKGVFVEKANLFSETAKREIASILRCDVSLIISEYEMELLQNTFKIDASILCYLPFLVETVSELTHFKSFEERNHFITIGNLLHQPNVDSVLYLKKEIWLAIRKQLPNAELHIYGAYAPQQILELHSKKEGFLIKGWAEDVSEVMGNARVCLAPLRFGAGLKGKLLDAMFYGTPSITTTIGAEGMHENLPFSGIVSDDVETLVNASVELYANKSNWLEAQQNGIEILHKRFQRELFFEKFKARIKYFQQNISIHRNNNFIGQILQHQTLQSTKYMSKWIEEKNK